ncbi:MAG: hypothetical protein QF615_01375, partial [Planctomycetota bacterium]|nr:hypothetical protein [Planctomycetota bacterium]
MRIALVLSIGTTLAWGAMPTSLPVEGTLLVEATLDKGLEAGVYGPQPVSHDEPAMISVVIFGNEATALTSGLVLMACAQNAAELEELPPPAGSYIPCGQWSSIGTSDWRPLLVVGPEGLWASRIVPMAHAYFEDDAGALLSSVIFGPKWPRPKRESAFRNLGEYDQTGVAFIVDEGFCRVESTSEIANATQPITDAQQSTGAHGIKASFPLILRDPRTTLGFWIALYANDKYLAQSLAAPMTPSTEEVDGAETVSGAPIVDAPQEGDAIGESLEVSGRTRPGALAV